MHTVGLISCKNTDNNSSSGNNTTQNESTSESQSDNYKITNSNDLIKLIGKSSDKVKKSLEMVKKIVTKKLC